MKWFAIKGTRRFAALVSSTCLLGLACEAEPADKPAEDKAAAAPETSAAEKKAELAAATVEAPKAQPEEPEKAARPKTIETEVTADRRGVLEEAYPDAKGFLVASELEEKLKKDKSLSAKAGAIKAFDKTTKGKWVLFTGPLVNPTDDGFDLAVSYTPLAPNDPMGISRQFFTVTFNEVEGYKKGEFKPGTMVAVLAKYSGDSKAGPGYELVATEKWK